jgi:hypothetical protein
MSPELSVSRSIEITAKPRTAWELVVDLERHPEWHPWDISDSNPQLVFGENRYGTQASYFWIGARGNHGTLKFVRVDEKAHTVDGILDISSLGQSRIFFQFQNRGAGVEVTETFSKHTGRNLFRRYLHPFYRAAAASQIEGNLSRLKLTAEGRASTGP